MKYYFVYITASQKRGTIYIGFTSDLIGRVWQHKNKIYQGFSAQYGVDKLVWYEVHHDAKSGCAKERKLKNWHRQWKIELIEKENPDWRDLYFDLIKNKPINPKVCHPEKC